METLPENIKESTDMTMEEILRATANRSFQRRLSVSSAFSPHPQSIEAVKGLVLMMIKNVFIYDDDGQVCRLLHRTELCTKIKFTSSNSL